jgi:hypothetical protein
MSTGKIDFSGLRWHSQRIVGAYNAAFPAFAEIMRDMRRHLPFNNFPHRH